MQMNAKISIIVGLLALAGCRNPGLPPEPPDHDAANPEATTKVESAEANTPADPFTRSAFEGVKLDGGGHHHHGHGKAKAEPAKAEPTETQPAETQPATTPDAHAGHGQGGRS